MSVRCARMWMCKSELCGANEWTNVTKRSVKSNIRIIFRNQKRCKRKKKEAESKCTHQNLRRSRFFPTDFAPFFVLIAVGIGIEKFDSVCRLSIAFITVWLLVIWIMEYRSGSPMQMVFLSVAIFSELTQGQKWNVSSHCFMLAFREKTSHCRAVKWTSLGSRPIAAKRKRFDFLDFMNKFLQSFLSVIGVEFLAVSHFWQWKTSLGRWIAKHISREHRDAQITSVCSSNVSDSQIIITISKLEKGSSAGMGLHYPVFFLDFV